MGNLSVRDVTWKFSSGSNGSIASSVHDGEGSRIGVNEVVDLLGAWGSTLGARAEHLGDAALGNCGCGKRGSDGLEYGASHVQHDVVIIINLSVWFLRQF